MTETMWLVLAVIALAAVASIALVFYLTERRDHRTEKAAHERTKADLDQARESTSSALTSSSIYQHDAHAANLRADRLRAERDNAHASLDLVLSELPREMTA